MRLSSLRLSLVSTLALAAMACNSLSPEQRLRLDVFDTYWEALDEAYPYFGKKGVDWHELREQYRPAAIYASRPSEFYHLLTGMLSELRDPHVSLTIPRKNWREGDEIATSLDDARGFARFELEGHVYVSSWPAGAAPIPPDNLDASDAEYPEILRIEGVPVVTPLVNNMVMGPHSSAAELVLCWSDGTRSRHELRRPSATEKTPSTARRRTERRAPVTLDRRGRMAHLSIRTLRASKAGAADEQAYIDRLDSFIDRAMEADALIMDLRDNGGGDYLVTRGIAGRFLEHPSRWVLPESHSSVVGFVPLTMFLHLDLPPRPPLFDKPVVVLTNWNTGSGAEHLARILQAEVGALVVGERSRGAEALIHTIEGPDGTVLRFGGTRVVDTRGRGFQDDGVIPDVAIPFRIEDVKRVGSYDAARTEWNDRVLTAATRLLGK